MKIDIKTKFLLHHDPKINLNRMKSKPYTPEQTQGNAGENVQDADFEEVK
jgi:hypothetical protein